MRQTSGSQWYNPMRSKSVRAAVSSASARFGSPAAAQAPVEIRATAPEKPPQIHIVEPSPATREATRPREADFYGEDVRVRHEPAFIEPFVGETSGGAKYGLSGWTAPATPVGSLVSQGERQTNAWPSLGFTVVWGSAPTGPPRRVSDPR